LFVDRGRRPSTRASDRIDKVARAPAVRPA
jgi:hypothetical protein